MIEGGESPVIGHTVELLRRPFDFAQYTSIRYTDRLADAGIAMSVGSVADALIGTFKDELINGRRFRTRDELEAAIYQGVRWYNGERLHSMIGDVPPAEYEALWLLTNTLDASIIDKPNGGATPESILSLSENKTRPNPLPIPIVQESFYELVPAA